MQGHENSEVLFVTFCKTIYDVPDDNTEAAFALCEEHEIKCRWITEKDCMLLANEKERVVVFPKFEGEAFELLRAVAKKNKLELVGPQCLKYIVYGGRDFVMNTRGNPTINFALQGAVVTLTGFSNVIKDRLEEKICLMNGAVSGPLASKVTHVVAHDMLSEKCKVAVERRLPIMTMDWIDQLWIYSEEQVIDGCSPPFISQRLCPLFHNLEICVSHPDPAVKELLKSTVLENGGNYSANLVRASTTVLIVAKPEGEKYKYAKHWKIPVVSMGWISSCVFLGHCFVSKDFEY